MTRTAFYLAIVFSPSDARESTPEPDDLDGFNIESFLFTANDNLEEEVVEVIRIESEALSRKRPVSDFF